MRDYQRSKVYSAEQELCHRTFRGAEQALSWGKTIAALEGREIGFHLNPRTSVVASCLNEKFVEFPKFENWWWDEIVILHEIAHTGIPWSFSPHGIEFCKEFLRLIKEYCSDPTMQCRMKSKFNKHGVHYQHNESYKKSLIRRFKKGPAAGLALTSGGLAMGTFETDGKKVFDKEHGWVYSLEEIAHVIHYERISNGKQCRIR